MPLVSIVAPCFQEAGNIREFTARVQHIMDGQSQVAYELVFIDNFSTDGTRDILRELAAKDTRIKVILNARNFGHVRSGYHALLASRGDCAIVLATDLQDPPELIPQFLSAWTHGARIVLGVKTSSEEASVLYALRSGYYRLLGRIADVQVVPHATGFGLYDQQVIEALRQIDDPYPYFRGLLAEIGYPPTLISFHQPIRTGGRTSQSFWTLYDLALTGIVSHSKIPLRLAVLAGVACALLSLFTGLAYLAYKLLYWDEFSLGIAPIVIGVFFLSAVQLAFIGVLGEYLGAVWTHVRHHPHVFEEERLNFSASPGSTHHTERT